MGYVIWKQILDIKDAQNITVPENAEFLTAGEQDKQLCIWYKCNPRNPSCSRHIVICGTGGPAPEGMRYVGTGIVGRFVWHVFEG